VFGLDGIRVHDIVRSGSRRGGTLYVIHSHTAFSTPIRLTRLRARGGLDGTSAFRDRHLERRLPDLRTHPETFTASFRGTPPKPVAPSDARVKAKASTNQIAAILHVAGR